MGALGIVNFFACHLPTTVVHEFVLSLRDCISYGITHVVICLSSADSSTSTITSTSTSISLLHVQRAHRPADCNLDECIRPFQHLGRHNCTRASKCWVIRVDGEVSLHMPFQHLGLHKCAHASKCWVNRVDGEVSLHRFLNSYAISDLRFGHECGYILSLCQYSTRLELRRFGVQSHHF